MTSKVPWVRQVQYITESLVVPLMRTYRHNLVPFEERRETVAEHSFHVACVVAQLVGYFPDLNEAVCVRIALQHDFTESIAGDVSVYASEDERVRHLEVEQQAVKVLELESFEVGVSISPMISYVEHRSREAGFVCAVDKIVPYFLVMAGEGHHAQPSPQQYEETRARARAHVARCFSRLLPLFDEVAERVQKRVEELFSGE